MKIWPLFAVMSIVASCTDSGVKKGGANQDRIDSTAIADLYAKAMLSADSSAYYTTKAEKIVVENGSEKCLATGLFLKGKKFLYAGQLDSVDAIANKGLQIHFQPEDSGFRGKFYNLKGNVEGYRRNMYASLDYYFKAEKIFESAHDYNSLAGIHNNVANNYFSLKDYKTALEYASKAYQLLDKVQEDRIKTNILSTYAISLNKTGQPQKALFIETKADSIASATNDALAKLASTIGYAEIYKMAKQFDKAESYYAKCIELSKKTGIKHFELISKVGLLSIYEEKGEFQQIVDNADSLLLLAQELNNSDVLHTSKRIIGRAYAQKGDYKKGFDYLNESYDLYSSTAGVENQKNINELRVKYESEKKSKKILQQRYQLAKQQSELSKRQTIIVTLALLVLLGLLVLFFRRRLMRSKQALLDLQLERKLNESVQKGEETERKRLAFEIHDGIAATLTGISYKLTNDDADKEEVIQLLKGLQEDSRKIAHNLMPVDFDTTNLVDTIKAFCGRMSTPTTEIIVLDHTEGFELNNAKSHLIYRTVQELIGNALKYAQCNSIFVKFERVTNVLRIEVEDDGLGIAKADIESGLNSLKERVAALQGKLAIHSQEQGTSIEILIEL
jgi:signal transduction histidine kinase